jgi:hypothetical protein
MALTFLVLPVAAVLCCLYRFLIHPLLLSPLAKLPNAHFTSPILPLWMWWNRRTGFETRSTVAAHQRHGPVVRMGPNEVSVASMDGLRRIFGGGWEKHPYYLHFANYNAPSLFSMVSPESHSARRRIMAHVFSKSYLQASPDFDALSRELILRRLLPVIQSTAATGKPVDVLHLFSAVSNDFMAAFGFGLRHSMDCIRDLDFATHYFDLGRVKLREEPGRDKAGKEMEEHCMAICRDVEADMNKEKAQEKETSRSLETQTPVNGLTDCPDSKPLLFAQLYAGFTKAGLSPEARLVECASEMLDSIDASREAIGNTMVYLTYELSRSPRMQASLRAELLGLSPNITLDPSLDDLPSPRDLDALPFLQAIVQETLRLHTSTPSPQTRVVPRGGAVIDGYVIPGGVRVSTASKVLHVNETVYPDALAFVPERWMPNVDSGGRDGDMAEMKRWFWPFSNGGKMCIGNHYSLQVIKLLVAAIYTNFTSTVIDDSGIEHRDNIFSGPVGDELILQFHPIAGGAC